MFITASTNSEGIEHTWFNDKQAQWARILQAAGCTYVAWDDVVARLRGAPQPEAVVVHNGAGPESQAQMALGRFASTHFVSPEWVVQCLVHQKKLSYTSNAHYRWDYHRPPATDGRDQR